MHSKPVNASVWFPEWAEVLGHENVTTGKIYTRVMKKPGIGLRSHWRAERFGCMPTG
jgi:site-specific recombinase XerC